MQLILISGLSGSGKSVALRVLEDAGYYCVDNLPAMLLSQLVAQMRDDGYGKVAVAMDMRGGSSISALPSQLRSLEAEGGIDMRFIFLDDAGLADAMRPESFAGDVVRTGHQLCVTHYRHRHIDRWRATLCIHRDVVRRRAVVRGRAGDDDGHGRQRRRSRETEAGTR